MTTFVNSSLKTLTLFLITLRTNTTYTIFSWQSIPYDILQIF